MTLENTDPLPDLAQFVAAAQKQAADSTQTRDSFQAIAFVDLSGSTPAKLESGNAAASRNAIAFTSLASSIASHLGGRVLKTLGDGAVASFADPLAACRAALNLRYATTELLGLQMTAGITSGLPLRIPLANDEFDLLGDVVDRAARIQSLASPGQVLIDGTLYDQLRGDLKAQTGWSIDAVPRRSFAKGIGLLDLYELALAPHWELKKQLATPFVIDASGRPTVEEKMSLIRNAKTEIVEMGIGLTSFAKYFTGQKPDEFRDRIRELVRAGIDLKCFMLDLTYEPGVAWLNEQQNPNYLTEAKLARDHLEAEAKFCRKNNYQGSLQVFEYRRVPEFWCLGVDLDDPLDGRMFFAPYLMGISRSAMPVVQVSRTSNPELYRRYLEAVRHLRSASNEPGA